MLALAVDKGGDAVVRRDPAAGAMGWTDVGIDPGGSLSGVSCPSSELCVAVGGQDVAFSNDPAAGASSWTLVHNVDQAIDYACGKHDPQPGAYAPLELTSVSCPSVSVCEAVDIDGGGVRSSAPGTTGGWPSFGGLEAGNNGGLVVCPSTGLGVRRPGRLTIIWSERQIHTVIANVAQSIQYAGATTITIALTRRGKRLLESAHRLKLIAHGTFAAKGTPPDSGPPMRARSPARMPAP